MSKLNRTLTFLLALAMLLAACAPAVTPTAVPPTAVPPTAIPATLAPTAIVAPTSVPATLAPTATLEPTATPEPAPDYAALFTTLIAGMPSDKGYGTVTSAVLNTEMAEKAPFLLDVREASELEASGFIKGAVHLPIKELLKNLDKLPGLNDPIVIYCASGHRGGFGFAALRLLGYTNVRNLAGGFNGWAAAKLAVEKGAPAAAAVNPQAATMAQNALSLALDGFLSNLPKGFNSISAADLNTKLADAATAPVLVDVRRADEYAKNGYLAGAVNVPLEGLMANLAKLPEKKDTAIVIYCVSGHRGSVAAMSLHLLGYTNVVNLGGGLNAWKAAKLPIVGYVDWSAVWGVYLTNLPAGYYTIPAADLNTLLADPATAPVLVDVRDASELETSGFIQGAINLPVKDLLKNLDKLPALDKPIVIYCVSGHRGALAMASLRLLGYTDVRNLNGGLGAWTKAQLAVVKDAKPEEPKAGTAATVDATRLRDLDAFLSALPKGFYTVPAADLNTELASTPAPFLLDVRTAEEIKADGYISGTLNLPITELFGKLDQLPKDKATKIVVLCKSGHRGAMVLEALRMIGYTEVRNLAGGMNAWIAAKLPVVK